MQDPDAEYLNQAQVVLTGLKLYDILQKVTEWEDDRKARIKVQDETDSSNMNANRNDVRSGDKIRNVVESGTVVEVMSSCEANELHYTANKTRLTGLNSLEPSNRDDLTDAEGLLTHNEIFDTPVAINANTPCLESRMARSHYTKVNEKTPDFKVSSLMRTNCDVSLKGVDSAWCVEAGRDRLTERNKKRKVVSHVKRSFEEADCRSSILDGHSLELERSQIDSAGPSQIILPSNLNHYPNIFALDDDPDETDDEVWPFSFHQEDPTQILMTGKRKATKLSKSPVKVFTETTNNVDAGTKDSGCPAGNYAKFLPKHNNIGENVSEKLKKFKFRKTARTGQT